MKFKDTIAAELKAIYATRDANRTLDRLARLADEAIETLAPEQAREPLFREQPDYSVNMPEYGLGARLARCARATAESWVNGTRWERQQIDDRLASYHDYDRARDEETP